MSTGEYIQSSIEALLNKNNSATEPPVVTQYMWWVDTSSSPSILKIRDGANSSWITIGNVETNLGLLVSGPGIITESLIANGAVTETKIADDAVSTAKVQNSAITSVKIADNAVTSSKVQDASIIESKIADNAVTSNKTQDSAIVESKIADDSVSTNKLKNNAVTLGKLALGTKGDIISYDVSGSATALPVGTTGQVLTASSGAVTGLQWQNPSDMSAVDDVATSNSFRNNDLIQSVHPGAVIIEKGWIDSFGNANEQGADETNSSGEQHDNVNKLYEGVPGATNQNSDNDYTTESNYIQQEWNKTNSATSDATFTNGSTSVTVASGTFPVNINNGRISADSGTTFFNIESGQGTNNLTLSENFTQANITGDYIIRLSEFSSGTVQLNEIEGTLNIGDGRDGSVSITTGVTRNINTEVVGSLRSTNADGIIATVSANPSTTSIQVASSTGFTAGDLALLINLRGSSSDTADVGNFEILEVSNIPDSTHIDVTSSPSKSYDGVTFSNQKVVLQRIPQYSSVTLNNGSAEFTCKAWDGTSGGIMMFACNGSVTVTAGKIQANEKGYRGGSLVFQDAVYGFQGEGEAGTGTQSPSANGIGGGGARHIAGSADGTAGGGGHATAGDTGTFIGGSGAGTGGGTIGSTPLTTIHFGGGGGGRGSNLGGLTGVSGGGIVYIIADLVSSTGTIESKGGDRNGSQNGFFSGAGAGGTILLTANTLIFSSSNRLDVIGGSDGLDAEGGDGRIRLEYSTIDGQDFPNPTEENDACNPDPGSTSLSGEQSVNVITEYVSVIEAFDQKEDTSAWSDINSASANEAVSLIKKAYYWLSYDPASEYGDGTEIKIFDQTASAWRLIAKNDMSVWKYNSAVSGSEILTTATTNDMLHAVSQAMSSQTANQMTGADLAAITDAEWEAANGFSTSVNSLARGVTLHSTSSSQNPSIDQYRINHDSDRASMDLRSKAFDPGTSPEKTFLWAKLEHTDLDEAGTFSVSRNGGTDWETVTMVQQGEAISGDIRILRSVHTFTTGASGEDLLARYVTVVGESQKLHSWGLQARS